MSERVFVTGMGIICAAGGNTHELLDSLKSSRSGIGRIRNLGTIHDQLPFAEVRYTDDELAVLAGITDRKENYSRTALLGIIAAKDTLKGRSVDQKIRAGLISATTVGGMPLNEKYFTDLQKDGSRKSMIGSFDCADSTERIADQLKIKQHVSTISTACSSSANAIMLGARMIRSGRLARVVAGGTDALTNFTIQGFNSLEILDREPCKPFDCNRKGLTLGEGAAYLLLEGENTADPSSILCELSGYGNANDAFHLTASSPEGNGAYLTMRKALENAGLQPEDISYVNAHGTGTDVNDLSEGRAVMRVFGEKVPHLSSTKSFTGHTLAAAGAVEAVISILSIRNGFIPANLNFINKIEELSFEPVRSIISGKSLKNVLSNSFGFGGNNTSLIFSSI